MADIIDSVAQDSAKGWLGFMASKHYRGNAAVVSRAPKLYSYIVANDTGFAPNPFYGYCTLATCKPKIRETAQVGDWIVGTGSKRKGKAGYAVYAMRVTEIMTFDEYWNDPRFLDKRPNRQSSSLKEKAGDNIYYRAEKDDEWQQSESYHDCTHMEKDTRVNRVLISDDFVYWGGDGALMPLFNGESVCCSTQGHKCRFDGNVVRGFIEWVRSLGVAGCCGSPLDWG